MFKNIHIPEFLGKVSGESSDTKCMEAKLTKTDRFLNLFRTLLKNEEGISDQEFREILGQPSKSQYHKYLVELTQDKPGRESVLLRWKSSGGFHYKLNRQAIQNEDHTYERPKLTLVGEMNFCEIRIYGKSRESFPSLKLPHDLLNRFDDHDHYKVRYSSPEDFLASVFHMAEDIEIITPQSLKDRYVEKAQKAVFNNVAADYTTKKVA